MVTAAAGTIRELIEGVGFITLLFVGMCVVAVFILRITSSEKPRIFSVSL